MASRSSRIVYAALVIGTIAAVTEMVPVFPIQAALGVSPRLVLQSIASGVLGRAAYSGGAATVMLGIAFHLLISVVATLLYVMAAERWALLSAVAYKQSTDWGMFATSLTVHIVGFGLPVALLDRWLAMASARRGADLAPAIS